MSGPFPVVGPWLACALLAATVPGAATRASAQDLSLRQVLRAPMQGEGAPNLLFETGVRVQFPKRGSESGVSESGVRVQFQRRETVL